MDLKTAAQNLSAAWDTCYGHGDTPGTYDPGPVAVAVGHLRAALDQPRVTTGEVYQAITAAMAGDQWTVLDPAGNDEYVRSFAAALAAKLNEDQETGQ